MFRKLTRFCLALLVASWFTVPASADTISLSTITQSASLSGSFSNDNDEVVIPLDLSADPLGAFVSIATSSYAAGGFATELTLLDGSGIFPALNDSEGSDAALSPGTLGAGMWTIVLTQQGNDPLGNSLSDGFSQDGGNGNDPNFTAHNAGFACGTLSADPSNPDPCPLFFEEASFSSRSGNWSLSVDVEPVAPVGSVPEPPESFLLLSGCVLAASRNRRRKGI